MGQSICGIQLFPFAICALLRLPSPLFFNRAYFANNSLSFSLSLIPYSETSSYSLFPVKFHDPYVLGCFLYMSFLPQDSIQCLTYNIYVELSESIKVHNLCNRCILTEFTQNGFKCKDNSIL